MAHLGRTILGCRTEGELKKKVRNLNNRTIFFRALFCVFLPITYDTLGFFVSKLLELNFYTIVLLGSIVYLFSYLVGLRFLDLFSEIFKKGDKSVWSVSHPLHLFAGLMIGFDGGSISGLGIWALVMIWFISMTAIPCDKYLKNKGFLI